MRRLSQATLAELPAEINRPRYERGAVKTGVVHLGLGAFHRAHQAVLLEAALAGGDHRWGILGASLRSPAVQQQMRTQDGLYSVVVREGAEERVQVIGAIQEVLVAPGNPGALIDALAHPDTHLVSLTVTEKGYKLDPATGALLEKDPDVVADLKDLSAPRTAPGFLVAALARRWRGGLRPFTALSCDNLPHNGQRLAGAVRAIARAHDRGLADWIEAEGAFPATMVDRIVPATLESDIAALSHRLGVEDQAMVKTEPFLQWVIEDRFCGPRPDFSALGAQLTSDVAPWEQAKLRLLNGAHSGIAYLGGLAGLDFVHDFVALPEGIRFVEALWDEATTTLSPPPGLDLPAYRAALRARFANSALQHRTRQIAMDGSQKLPQRLLASIAHRRERGRPVPALTLAVAAWMRWQTGRDEAGRSFVVDDPLAAVTARCIAGIEDPAQQAQALLSIEAIFPPSLAADGEFRASLARHCTQLAQDGVRRTLASFER